MARTATPRTLLATALTGVLVVGLAACGGDDDAEGTSAENPIVVPEVTLPGGITIPDVSGITIPEVELPGGTLPGGITVPDVSGITVPDLSTITLPGGMTLDEMMNNVPDFSGEGSAGFCQALERLDELDELDESTPAQVQAAIPQVQDIYNDLRSAAPSEISAYVEVLVGSMADAIEALERNGYDPDAVDFDMMSTPELMQAGMAIGSYTDEFCES